MISKVLVQHGRVCVRASIHGYQSSTTLNRMMMIIIILLIIIIIIIIIYYLLLLLLLLLLFMMAVTGIFLVGSCAAVVVRGRALRLCWVE